uniref:Uncharacterized protein n=1 Tax=Opuntia streptacantha TaxID=393608 RepID=A0A7C9AFP4_OPUST
MLQSCHNPPETAKQFRLSNLGGSLQWPHPWSSPLRIKQISHGMSLLPPSAKSIPRESHMTDSVEGFDAESCHRSIMALFPRSSQGKRFNGIETVGPPEREGYGMYKSTYAI